MGLKAEVEGRLASWWGWKCDICALLGGVWGCEGGGKLKRCIGFLMSENKGSGLSH